MCASPMSALPTRIGICGAGISGLTLAGILSRTLGSRARITVLERAPADQSANSKPAPGPMVTKEPRSPGETGEGGTELATGVAPAPASESDQTSLLPKGADSSDGKKKKAIQVRTAGKVMIA